jgi:hypothetical protein
MDMAMLDVPQAVEILPEYLRASPRHGKRCSNCQGEAYRSTPPVCTENLIGMGKVTEPLKLAERRRPSRFSGGFSGGGKFGHWRFSEKRARSIC